MDIISKPVNGVQTRNPYFQMLIKNDRLIQSDYISKGVLHVWYLNV